LYAPDTLRLSSQGGWYGNIVWEKQTSFYSETLSERHHVEESHCNVSGGRGEWEGRLWVGFSWLRAGLCSSLLWTRRCTFRFHSKCCLSPERLSISREFFFIQLVHLVTLHSLIKWILKCKLSLTFHY